MEGERLDVAHVVPANDLIEHSWQTREADCVCGPSSQPIKRDDGSVGWVITHHSLDGREAREQEGATTMAHHAPTPTEDQVDARSRAGRTLLHALAVTVLVGAATGVYQLAADGAALSLATVGTAAGTGALMALAAYVQRAMGK